MALSENVLFSPETIRERLTAVRQHLPTWEVDGVLIGSPSNRRWLSGFTGSNAQLLITNDQALLATDFRYYEQAAIQAPAFTLFKHERTQEANEQFIRAAGVVCIGLEAKHTTLAQMADLEEIEGIQWQPLEETVELWRRQKSAAELTVIRAAAAITDQVMAQVPELVRPGKSERQVAWELEKGLREAGADAVAFTVVVASGPNSALPHHRPGARQLQAGDVLIVDMGAELNGYKSDMTRSFYLGSDPTDRFWEIYRLVQAAQTAVFEQVQPGMGLKTADSLARTVIDNHGHGQHFGHGLGHGVGLDVHEDPMLSPRASDEDTLAAGMTVTIEPGVYVPGWGGVRIEDLAVVTDDGLSAISQCPKQPVIPIE